MAVWGGLLAVLVVWWRFGVFGIWGLGCYIINVLFCYAFIHVCLLVDALWSHAGKGLTSWLSFVMSNCDVVTFPLVSWVRCGV